VKRKARRINTLNIQHKSRENKIANKLARKSSHDKVAAFIRWDVH